MKYAGFSDPDGNTLTLQEMAWRTGDQFIGPARRAFSHESTELPWEKSRMAAELL